MLPAECKVLAVFEDWAGDGAGNGAYAHTHLNKLAPLLLCARALMDL